MPLAGRRCKLANIPGATMRTSIDRHSALIYTMVLVSAAEGQITDPELQMMGRLVQSLPVFKDFETDRILALGRECAELLNKDDGLDLAIDLIARALPQPLRETAYALACDVAAADGRASQDELRMLEILRQRLHLDPLVTTAIERGAQARFRIA
jgi:tellurite resistance protein